jgi:hypothetical protein
MRKERKFSIDLLPVMGIIGLALVILYFLLSTLNPGSAGEPPTNDRYHLFTRLYKQLGYSIIEHYPRHLPKPRENMIIYFDYQENPKELKKLINHWVKKGGTLWIAGIEGDKDPISSCKLASSKLKTVYDRSTGAEEGSFVKKTVVRLKGTETKHFAKDNKLDPDGILLESRQGPLCYKIPKGDGWIFALSDSSLLSNEFLQQDKAAVFFNRMLQPYFGRRIYTLRSDLLGQRNASKTIPVLALLFKDKLLFITLQILWILALFMARQGKRFGEPQLIDPYARRTLTEHLKAIGHFYWKTGNSGIVDEINGEYFKYMLGKLTGLQWKDNPTPEDIQKIKTQLSAHDPSITPEQIRDCLKKDPRISTSRLLHKAKAQDRILGHLKVKSQKSKVKTQN